MYEFHDFQKRLLINDCLARISFIQRKNENNNNDSEKEILIKKQQIRGFSPHMQVMFFHINKALLKTWKKN